MLKKSFYLYKRCMWYFGVFLAEIDGLLQIVKYIGLATIAFATIHVILSVFSMVFAGILMLVGGVITGIILVKSGSVQITQELNNQQNPQVMEILREIKKFTYGGE